VEDIPVLPDCWEWESPFSSAIRITYLQEFLWVFFTAVQQLAPILRLRLRSWLTAGDQSMVINQHKKKTAIEAANIFKKQYLPF
jgi:hypothetical protein